jgi:hypothetical protein
MQKRAKRTGEECKNAQECKELGASAFKGDSLACTPIGVKHIPGTCVNGSRMP